MSQSRTDPALRNAQPMNEDKHQLVTHRPAHAEAPIEKERGIEQGGISFAPSFDSFSAGFGISNLNRQANIVFEFLVDSLSAVTVCVQFN